MLHFQFPLDFHSLTLKDWTNPPSNSVIFLFSLKKKECIGILGEFASQVLHKIGTTCNIIRIHYQIIRILKSAFKAVLEIGSYAYTFFKE